MDASGHKESKSELVCGQPWLEVVIVGLCLQVKAGPKGFQEKRRKSKVDEARDILAHVVLCHVPVQKYNFQNKVRSTVTPGR